MSRHPADRSVVALRTRRTSLVAGVSWLLCALLQAGGPALARAAADPTTTARQTVDRVVLRVNDRIATLRELERRIDDRRGAILAANLPAERRDPLLESAAQDALREVFEELLILSRADQLSIHVTEADVDRAMAAAKERSGLADDAQFEAALREAGLNRASLRERLRRNELFQEVIGREVQSRVTVDDEDLLRYYREHPEEFVIPAEVKLREIVVLEEATPDPAARERLVNEVTAALVAGESLDDVAARYREAGTVSPVIDLGFVVEADLEPALRSAVGEHAVGSTSGPVAGRGGVHFVQVLGRREAKRRPYEEVEDELRGRERARRFEIELETYMEELEARSYVEATPPPEAAGFRARRREDLADELTRAMEAADRVAKEGEAAATSGADTADAAPSEPPPVP